MPAKCKLCKAPATLKAGLFNFCDIEHAYEYSKLVKEKQQANKVKKQRQSDRERKKALKSRSEWLKDLQAVFNKFVRLRDKGLPCISCGHPDDGSRQRHASHYKSVGSTPALRFCQINCFAACSICNNYLSGNLVPYRAALIDKIGIEQVEWLEGPHSPLKLTIPEIQAMISEYKLKVKEMEKAA
jgi:hypothetical protein